jgi:cytochrome c oxidase subunit 3
MKRDYSRELEPDVRKKMKKNLVYVGIFSIVMMFAGFTSAYIVSMGDSFWLKYPLPNYQIIDNPKLFCQKITKKY